MRRLSQMEGILVDMKDSVKGTIMSLHSVSLREAEGHLSELVELAGKGEEVVINLDNGAIVKLVVEQPADRERMFGLYEGKVQVSEDFDKELPKAFWIGNGTA